METELNYRGMLSPQGREAFKNKSEISDIKPEREMIVCAELLLDHEKEMVKTTAMFAVQNKDGQIFFVQPSALVPASYNLLRSSGSPAEGGGRPIRLGAVKGGIF